MGPKRGGLPPPIQHPPSPSQPPPPPLSQFPPLPSSNSPPLRHHHDTNPLQMDLQLHRDQTSATFLELRETMEQMRSQNSALRSELLDELRQLRIGPKIPVEPSCRSESSSPKSSSSSPPASVNPPVSLISATNGNLSSGFPDLSVLPLYHSFVTGAMNSNTHNSVVHMDVRNGGSSMVTVPVFSMTGMGLSGGSVVLPMGPQYLSAPQYSHMPGFGSHSQPLLVSQPQIEPNSFNFTYSGPYPVSYIDCGPTSTQLCSQAPPYIPLVSHLRSKQPSISLSSTPTYSVTTSQYPHRQTQLPIPSVAPYCSPHYQMQYANDSPPQYPPSGHVMSTTPFLPQFPCPSDPQLPTMKQMRLDFPIFSGGDPVEWLNKAEQYFALYQIPDDRKVTVAAMHLIDEAADMWHLFQHEYPRNWVGFADLLMRQFGSYNRIDYQAALAKLQQMGSVADYKSQFTKLSCRAPGFSQEVLLACFVGGLKEEISDTSRTKLPNI